MKKFMRRRVRTLGRLLMISLLTLAKRPNKSTIWPSLTLLMKRWTLRGPIRLRVCQTLGVSRQESPTSSYQRLRWTRLYRRPSIAWLAGIRRVRALSSLLLHLHHRCRTMITHNLVRAKRRRRRSRSTTRRRGTRPRGPRGWASSSPRRYIRGRTTGLTTRLRIHKLDST
jgi:hypothetical protein